MTMPTPNYDHSFLERKRVAALTNTPLVPQWTVTKTLTPNDQEQQQLTGTNEQFMALFNLGSIQQLALDVLDFDDGTLHKMIIRQHEFCKGWVDNFVNRRSLVPGQLVGFYYDQEAKRLLFSLLNDERQAPNWTFRRTLKQRDLRQLVMWNEYVDALFGSHTIRSVIANLGLNERCFLDVLDYDKGTVQKITLGRFTETGYAFCGEWVQDFVNRRPLDVGDLVGFYWLHGLNKLVFSVLEKSDAAIDQLRRLDLGTR